MKRTVKNLSEMNGRVYVYISDKETGKAFLQAAESEGFTFGDGIAPAKRDYAEIMAVNHNGTINYVGAMGRMAFGSGTETVNGEKLLRIDYKKYVSGEEEYYL